MKEHNELKADLCLLSFARENLSLSAFGPIAPPGRERLQQVRQINSIYSVGLLTCLFVFFLMPTHVSVKSMLLLLLLLLHLAGHWVLQKVF
jgi:hypothetical protein